MVVKEWNINKGRMRGLFQVKDIQVINNNHFAAATNLLK